MRVGAIVPVYGWAPYLAEALDSVLAESPAEAVVVDDGSPLPVSLHPDHAGACMLVRRGSRGGPAVARETGLTALEACDAVALCDADDVWRPGFLAAAAAVLRDADVVVGRPEVVGPDDRPTGERWPLLPAGPFAPSYEHNFIAPSSVVLRRDALERAGGFAPGGAAAPSRFHAEDWDLWLRLRAAGARFVSVPAATILYRRRAGALSADVAALARAQIAMHERHAPMAAAEERARADAADASALAAGLTRERRFAEARAVLRSAGAAPLRRAALSVPLARRALGRRDPYRRGTRFGRRRRPAS